MKREFLMLAHKFTDDPIGGWFCSEKLNGMRAYWDGGISRGLKKIDIPWANTDKDERYKDYQVCTGLWSRLGNVLHAPDWWLDTMPQMPLDGELWIGRRQRQSLMKIVKDLDNLNWGPVKYMVFETPAYEMMFDGSMLPWGKQALLGPLESQKIGYSPKPNTPFWAKVDLMKEKLHEHNLIKIVDQVRLPWSKFDAYPLIEKMLLPDACVNQGIEGYMLRSPDVGYECCRSHRLLKAKPWQIGKGKVIGYTYGKGKFYGMMGALVIETIVDIEGYDPKSVILELSGFTDQERRLSDSTCEPNECKKSVREGVTAVAFPMNSEVSYKFNDTSEDGVPQEARYMR
ncbi:MAG: hypothetical protein M0R80_13370 [Proteobacteria bacterium]|jgi:DNA ligase-1|nr:hypothetical protein [Pseudomonadota bacterium]